MVFVVRPWKAGTDWAWLRRRAGVGWGSTMERGELVEHIKRHSNRWPDSGWGDSEGKLAKLMEDRLLRVVGDQRVIWANGGPMPTADHGVSLSVVVFTEAYVIADDAEALPGRGTAREGAVRVIPWTELKGLTLRESWLAGEGADVGGASFVVHLGDALDVDVSPGRREGYPAASELLNVVLGKLAAKQ